MNNPHNQGQVRALSPIPPSPAPPIADLSPLFASRIGGRDFGTSGNYKFQAIKDARRKAMTERPDVPVLDFGVGEPHIPAHPLIVQSLVQEAGKPENRFYADNGIQEFQEAAASWMSMVYGVTGLDPQTQIIHGIGSKPLLAMLPACFINPGDVTLLTVPGYPVLGTWTQYMGGEVFGLPLLSCNGFLPDYDAIPAKVLAKAKLLYINYPNNPTGACATREFFERTVAFAKANNILVIHDASYAAVVYEDRQPLSFLSVPGAIETGIELLSLSKAFCMTGWRLAFAAGNAQAIKALASVKDHSDSGQFRAIQKAGVAALKNPWITKELCVTWGRRLQNLSALLQGCGFDVTSPQGGFYCYVPSPGGTQSGRVFANAAEAATYLMEECHISVVPWDEAGAFLRFSVTFEANTPEEEISVFAELERRLLKADFIF